MHALVARRHKNPMLLLPWHAASTMIVDARGDVVLPSIGSGITLTPAQAVLDQVISNGTQLPMALANGTPNGGFVSRQYTCSVDSIPGTCPGIAALKGRDWDLGLAPTADVLLFGPSFMNQIADALASFTHVTNDPLVAVDNLFEEGDPLLAADNLFDLEEHLPGALPVLSKTPLMSTKQCNIEGTDDRCLWTHGAVTLTFRSGTRLTIVQNSAAYQDDSDGAIARLEDLLRNSTFNHVFYMPPHGKEYFAEQIQARKEGRTASEESINDAQGRNMCLKDGNGTDAIWGDYLECVTAARSFQTLEHILPSSVLSLVVPWMQAVPEGARAFGQPVVSTFEEASAHGCEMTHDGIGEGEPSEGPLGRVIHQCVVVCEQGDALKAALEQRKPDGPCSGGSVALVAQKLASVLRSSQR